jgi:hypothetical protein
MSQERRRPMKAKLSSRLSPGAKKQLLSAREGEVLHSLLQVAPTANVPGLCQELEAVGAAVRSWMEETRLMSIDIPAERLADVADLQGVTYVEAGTKYFR